MPKKRKKLEDYDRPLNVALYVRVSTEEQAEGFSLDSQLERLKAFCKAHDWKIVGIFREEGESARTIKRPQYQDMMSLMDQWDGIVVVKMDRIHRNSKNFMTMMDRLRAKEKHFISMTENLDTSTAMGRFVMDIIQRIAQLESEQIGERTYDGMVQKADTDEIGILGFHAPFGYDFENEELVVNKVESKKVKAMFQAYIDGNSLENIAKDLNTAGIRTKRGNPWERRSVGYILRNPIYAGWLLWDGHLSKGMHEPIIDIETFNEAQKGRRNAMLIEEG